MPPPSTTTPPRQGRPGRRPGPRPLPRTEVRAAGAARDAAVVCDLAPLSVLSIAGADAAAFLQGSCPPTSAAFSRTPAGTELQFPERPDARELRPLARSGRRRLRDALPADVAPSVAKRLSMYVLALQSVLIADVSADTGRFGVGGPAGDGRAGRASLGVFPRPFELRTAERRRSSGLPGPRYVVLAPAGAAKPRGAFAAARCRRRAIRRLAVADDPRRRAGRHRRDTGCVRRADGELGRSGRRRFQERVLYRAGDHRPDAHLGRLKERAFPFHADAPASRPGRQVLQRGVRRPALRHGRQCGAAPGGGCDLLAVLQIAAQERGDARLRAPDGPPLVPLPLPYAIPAAASAAGARRLREGAAPRVANPDSLGMCIALIAFGVHPKFRSSSPRTATNSTPVPPRPRRGGTTGILAGRDLKEGGTWLGIDRRGALRAAHQRARSFAARSARALARRPGAAAAGADPAAPSVVLPELVAAGSRHNGFNLVAGDAPNCSGARIAHRHRRRSRPASMACRTTCSIRRGRRSGAPRPHSRAGATPRGDRRSSRRSSRCCGDTERAPDEALPATGVPLEWERMLSAPFIVSPTYGTRCSTVVTIDRDGNVRFVERGFDARATPPAKSTTDSRCRRRTAPRRR